MKKLEEDDKKVENNKNKENKNKENKEETVILREDTFLWKEFLRKWTVVKVNEKNKKQLKSLNY